jgi:SAM-dependent methyltransferase
MGTDLFNLGDLYVSDFLAEDENPRSDPWPLRLVMEDDGLVHLAEQPPPELMWGRYWYRSGVSATMQMALESVVDYAANAVDYESGDIWLDIACNDGTLLREVPNAFVRIGVDPAEDSIANDARSICNAHYQRPFDMNVAFDVAGTWGLAKVVTCAAMFYDLLDPAEFLAAVRSVMRSDGILVLQLSYSPLMLGQLAFDNICHEHARYYSMRTLQRTLRRGGFDVVDVELNDVNGGSFRVTAMRDDADVSTFASAPYRDVAHYRRRALLDRETILEVNDADTWLEFWREVNKLGEQVSGFIRDMGRIGKTVWAYGASTKGNTLLQLFELDSTLITAIAERSPAKYGRRTVGTNIPIVDEDTWRAAAPDFTLVLPWHFISEFRHREAAYLSGGGRFIVPCPAFDIIGA